VEYKGAMDHQVTGSWREIYGQPDPVTAAYCSHQNADCCAV